eukprot:UN08186
MRYFQTIKIVIKARYEPLFLSTLNNTPRKLFNINNPNENMIQIENNSNIFNNQQQTQQNNNIIIYDAKFNNEIELW